MTEENELNEKGGEVFDFPSEMVEEIEDEARADELEAAAPSDELLGLPEFQQTFAHLFGIAAAITGVQSLEVADSERAGCDKTAEKVYSLLSTSPTLRRWFLANGGALFGDWLIVASFVGRKALNVAAEVKGVDKKDMLTAAGERIGRGMFRGIFGKLAFWKKGE